MTRRKALPQPLDVHPAASIWPMLPADELQALADDIAQHGLIHPIMRTPDGVVLDGRNRLAACQLAGVDPVFATHDGDPVAYVLSANARRRDMSKGAKAMASAQVTSNLSVREAANLSGANREHMRQAAMVAKWAPELVPGVIAGSPTLDSAYQTAKERKTAADTDEGRYARLTTDAPDLAELVSNGAMTLDEATAAAKERARRAAADAATEAANRAQATTAVRSAIAMLANPAYVDWFTTDLAEYAVPITAPEITAAAAALTELADRWPHE